MNLTFAESPVCLPSEGRRGIVTLLSRCNCQTQTHTQTHTHLRESTQSLWFHDVALLFDMLGPTVHIWQASEFRWCSSWWWASCLPATCLISAGHRLPHTVNPHTKVSCRDWPKSHFVPGHCAEERDVQLLCIIIHWTLAILLMWHWIPVSLRKIRILFRLSDSSFSIVHFKLLVGEKLILVLFDT